MRIQAHAQIDKRPHLGFHRALQRTEGGQETAGRYEARVNHDFDEWEIAAICEYQAKTAQNNHQYVILNIATRESRKNDKGDSKPAPNGTASMPAGTPSKFAKTLQKGQLITLEGTMRGGGCVEEGRDRRREF
jgi:hypothetical protein